MDRLLFLMPSHLVKAAFIRAFHYPRTFPVSIMYLETRERIMPEMNGAIQMYAFGKYSFSIAPFRTHTLLNASLCAVHVP